MNYNILFFDKIDVIELIISIHIKMDEALIMACREGDFRTANHLIALGRNVNGKGRYYHSPLGTAIGCGHHNIVKLLLENGALVNKPDPLGTFPLTMSIFIGNISTIELLLKAGADRYLTNRSGRKPMDTINYRNDDDPTKKFINEYPVVISLQLMCLNSIFTNRICIPWFYPKTLLNYDLYS